MVTLPARMQDVQTERRFGEPFTMARTRWMFGFHRRFVRRCEWEMLMPNDGFFPHTSHTAAMTRYLSEGFREPGEVSITGQWRRSSGSEPST